MTAPLIYGAYGYTGKLVAREAVEAGLDPVLAGRREQPLRELASSLGVDYQVATLEGLERVLADDMAICLHCAGPYVDTYEPAVEACLATQTHYLDVSGEVPVIEAVHEYNDRALDAGAMLMPAVGFDVVPSNCLAVRLREHLPDATELTLACVAGSDFSPGTARFGVHMLASGVYLRENGDLRTVPFGSRTRDIDTGTGYGSQRMGIYPRAAVSTAYHATGIPNIEAYAPTVLGLSTMGQRVLGRLQPLIRRRPVQRVLMSLADRLANEPDASERAGGSAFFWGEVSGGGRTVSGRVHTAHPYTFTAAAMVEVTQRVLAGEAPPGYQTPASAYDAGLVEHIEGTRFEGISPRSEN